MTVVHNPRPSPTTHGADLIGCTVPRIYTPPLAGRGVGAGENQGCPCGCALSPETSRGFEVIDWVGEVELRDAEGRLVVLDPWQRFLLIHALELDADRKLLRFLIVVVLVARQNGKTLVKAVLSLWRMFEGGARYLVGTAQDLSQAREVMSEVLVPMIMNTPTLKERFDPDNDDLEKRRGIWHKTLNDEYFRLDCEWRGGRAVPTGGEPRYLIKALNRKAGRGLSGVREVNIDELREQRDFAGWGAISKVVMAAKEAQIWCMSNMGDSLSLLLNHLRGVGLSGTDPAMFLAEWSAEEGCELDDTDAWRQANPSLGFGRLTRAGLQSSVLSDPPNVFRTECLCQGVDIMNTAIDPAGWAACADSGGGVAPLGSDVAYSLALCVDMAVEGEHVIAATAAVLPSGRARIDLVGVWDDTARARRGIAELKKELRPKVMGWFPKGPGAALSATLRKLGASPITGLKQSEACMTLANYVDGRRLIHPDSPILNDHARHTGSVGSTASWVFDRGPGATHGMWAAAGALHLALNEPERVRRGRRIIVAQAPEEQVTSRD